MGHPRIDFESVRGFFLTRLEHVPPMIYPGLLKKPPHSVWHLGENFFYNDFDAKKKLLFRKAGL